MKKLLSLFLLLCSMNVFAQNNSINGINISISANPDANTANWGQGISPFTISARTTLDSNRQVDATVVESRVLVTIKKSGSKVCGTYTSTSAPFSGFNTPVKVWNRRNAVSLLGQDCVLPPGEYELCVQFFGNRNGTETAFSEEKCRSFNIAGATPVDNITYQPPQNIAPADGTKIKEADAKKPVVFRWTPVVPKPREPVTYRIKVWQLMQGQNGTTAMKSNQPIVTKDVDNITQTTVANILTERCREPYRCDWVWMVEALSKEQVQGTQKSYGVSAASSFSVANFDCIYNFTTRITDSICLGNVNGMDKYRICFNSNFTSTINDLKFLNTGSGIKAYLPVAPYTVYTITGMPTLVPQLHGGTNPIQNYCIEVLVPPGVSTIRINLQGDDNDPDPNNNCSPGATTDVKLPSCICNFCQKAVEFDNDQGTATLSGNNLNIVQPLWDMASNTIISVKAEVISFDRYVGDECMSCNKDAALWGNFTSGKLGSLTGTFGNAVSPVTGNTHHTLYWNLPTGYTGAVTPFTLNINTPPLSTLNCCCEKIKTKIRYTYTFRDKATGECKTCNGGVFEYEAQKGTCPATTTSTGGGVKQH